MNSRLIFVALACMLFSLSAAAVPRGAGGYGQLVIKRSANFGLNLTLSLWIDGRPAAPLQLGRTLSASLPAGTHQIMARVSQRRLDSAPIIRRVVIKPGTTTELTAGFHGQDLVLQ